MSKMLIVLLLGTSLIGGETKPTLSDFRFLTGHWRCEVWGGVGEEVWMAPSGGNMLGMFRFIKGGKLEFSEIFGVEERAGGLTFLLRHFSPGLKAWEDKESPLEWKIAEWKQNETLFTREGVTLRYKLESPDVLVATMVSTKGGKTETHVFRFQRVKER
ncbi:MAG: hypothetical protein JNL98_06370 [Bryobacterales bacterium]|nr:hypothetical protein [Bryobacterales bacterium]